MINRIIFLTDRRFDLRDYQRFGIELLEKNGFHVETWDLTNILHPEFFKKSNSLQDLFTYMGLALFNSKLEVYNKLENLARTDFVISFISYNFYSMGIYRALSKSYADYAVSCTNVLPAPVIKKGFLDLMIDSIKKIASFRHPAVWKRLFTKLPLRCLKIKPAVLLLAGGDRSFNRHYLVDTNTDVLQMHTLDYDIYLLEKDNPYTDKPIAVFLDEFFPFHPDFVVLGKNSPFNDHDYYYESLNIFFTLLEKKTGLEVIIGAHPRSDYENRPDYFKGRKCIKGRTINLIKESKLILAHSSTALNFAALFYKPVIFMTFQLLTETWEGRQIKEMSKWFGKEPIFIDNFTNNGNSNGLNLEKELTVKKDFYDKYRDSYIKSKGSDDLPCWQIVADKLKEY